MSRYNTSLPFCYENRCVCPPQYDPLPVRPAGATPGISHMLPMKCDKRDLKVMMAVSPRDSVYKGEEATVYCCINLDAREFIPRDGVLFIQNGTRSREPTQTPYDIFTAKDDTLFTVATCWLLTLFNVQLSDSGNYTCIVQPKNPLYPTLNETINFTVKSKYNRLLTPNRRTLSKRNKESKHYCSVVHGLSLYPLHVYVFVHIRAFSCIYSYECVYTWTYTCTFTCIHVCRVCILPHMCSLHVYF